MNLPEREDVKGLLPHRTQYLTQSLLLVGFPGWSNSCVPVFSNSLMPVVVPSAKLATTLSLNICFKCLSHQKSGWETRLPISAAITK